MMQEFLDYNRADVEFQKKFQKIESGFRLKLRADDYLGLLLTFVFPALYFVFVGIWWFLLFSLVFGYLWAVNAGSTDFENSLEFGNFKDRSKLLSESGYKGSLNTE